MARNTVHRFLFLNFDFNSLLLCIIYFLSSADFFKSNFTKGYVRNTIRVSNNLDPEQLFVKVISRRHYCAYRNSVNSAFLRLFWYVRTDRALTIRT